MEHSLENNQNKTSLPIVIVYPNGFLDQDLIYAQISRALEEANVECILIDGHFTSHTQLRGQITTRASNITEPTPIKFSIVIPIYNEEDNLPELYRRLNKIMTGIGETYEIIFINDGSSDHSLELLEDLVKIDSNVHVLSLSRNFGHQQAICAGLDYSHGQAVIVMDGDLQDPPEVIPQFISMWRENYQVVYAIREKRKEFFLKRFLYHSFYLLLRSLARVDIPLDAGDFCLMDRSVVNIISALPERNRFVRGLRSWAGYRQIGLAYERDPRYAGDSKYSFKRLVSLAMDGLISFSYLPLRIATFLGITVSVFSLVAAIYYIWLKLTVGLQPPGFATLTVLLLFLGGVQMVTVGIIGEYIGHILNEVKGRPTYVVQQVIEHQNAVQA